MRRFLWISSRVSGAAAPLGLTMMVASSTTVVGAGAGTGESALRFLEEEEEVVVVVVERMTTGEAVVGRAVITFESADLGAEALVATAEGLEGVPSAGTQEVERCEMSVRASG